MQIARNFASWNDGNAAIRFSRLHFSQFEFEENEQFIFDCIKDMPREMPRKLIKGLTDTIQQWIKEKKEVNNESISRFLKEAFFEREKNDFYTPDFFDLCEQILKMELRFAPANAKTEPFLYYLNFVKFFLDVGVLKPNEQESIFCLGFLHRFVQKFPDIINQCPNDSKELVIQSYWECIETATRRYPELWSEYFDSEKILKGEVENKEKTIRYLAKYCDICEDAYRWSDHFYPVGAMVENGLKIKFE